MNIITLLKIKQFKEIEGDNSNREKNGRRKGYMIPKIIHYVWLSGDPFPEKIQKCIDSWKKYLPDYEIKQWNTENFDIESIPWVKQAYDNKKYAFATDYIRFYALYNEGGIYLDSDVEILKPIDRFLDTNFFFGYEYTGLPEAAVIGAVSGTEWLKRCYEWYLDKNLYVNGNFEGIVCPMVMRHGFELAYPEFHLIDNEKVNRCGGGRIYPYFCFSPKNGFNGEIKFHKYTYCIHHFNSAWLSGGYSNFMRSKIHLAMIKVLGKKKYNKLMYEIRNRLHKT